MKVLYFAYGSNMSTERLRQRVPSAKPICKARLNNKRVVFNKRSTDGSGKANLSDSIGDETWGVLFEVDATDINKLDNIEGGYKRTSLQTQTVEGNNITAEVYISNKLTNDPVAYDWYKELILTGAKEHNLPKSYLAYLEQLPSQPQTGRIKT